MKKQKYLGFFGRKDSFGMRVEWSMTANRIIWQKLIYRSRESSCG